MARGEPTASATATRAITAGSDLIEFHQMMLGLVQSILKLVIDELAGVNGIEEAGNALCGALSLLGNACEELARQARAGGGPWLTSAACGNLRRP